MIPNQELKALSSALMNTQEYKNMKNKRNIIKGYPQLFKQTLEMEKSRTRIVNSTMPPNQKQKMLSEQMRVNSSLLSNPDIQNFFRSVDTYQKMFSECISYINKTTDSNMTR